VVCFIIDKAWHLIVTILCVPIAALGLIFDKLRIWVKMCPKTRCRERVAEAKQNRRLKKQNK
jgi:hypothetical protein